MKFWLTVTLIIASCSAAAGDYSDAVERQSKCDAAGKLAQSYFRISPQGLRKALKKMDEEARTKKVTEEFATDTKGIFVMGYLAKSSSEAYMQAWGWCMDKEVAQ